MARIRADESFHRGYLVHALKHLEPRLKSQTNGTGIPHVDREVLEGFQVFRPTALEQTRVAQVLDTLDATIRQTEAIIEKLKQVKQGLLNDLLTRGIDANGELRPPQSQAPHLYKDSPLGWTPNSWSVLSLDELVAAPICYGIVQVFAFVPDGVPVLAIKDLLGDYVSGVHRTAKSIDAAYSRSRVKPGDVLVSIKGTIGRVGVVPDHYTGNISRDMARFRPAPMIGDVPEDVDRVSLGGGSFDPHARACGLPRKQPKEPPR